MSQTSAPWDHRPAPVSAAPAPTAPAPRVGAVDPLQVLERFKRVLPYHRLALADRRHGWWMPLVEGLIIGALYLLASILFTVVMLTAAPGVVTEDILEKDQLEPAIFFFTFGSVALLFPCAVLARLVLGPRPLGLLFSVTGRIRWRWLLTSLAVATAIFVVVLVADTLLQGLGGEGTLEIRPVPGFWLLVLMMVVLVPVQCAAEELVFRGYLAQMIGRWLKHPAWAILLPVPLFVLGHLYDVWGQASVGVMAVAMGLVTWRTGGLESGIAVHVVNNVLVSLTAALGLTDMNDTTGSPTDLVTTVILNGLFVAVIFWLVKRNPDLATTRTVILPPPATVPPVPAWPVPGAYAAGHGMPGTTAPVAAVRVLDERTGGALVLPPQYGPYVVHDAAGCRVGVVDTGITGTGPVTGAPHAGPQPLDPPPEGPGSPG